MRIVDLTVDKEGNKDDKASIGVAVELLNSIKEWRSRAVERIDLTSASWADRRRSIQVEPLRGHIKTPKLLPHHKKATLWLPVGNFPKGPLLDFNLEVAGERPLLLRMNKHCNIFAQRIAFLATKADIPISSEIEKFLEAIFCFTTASWQELHRERRLSPEARQECVLKYLKKYPIGGFPDGQLSPGLVRYWDQKIEPIRNLVELRMVPTIDNASANPLLALRGAASISNKESNPLLLDDERKVEQVLDALIDFLIAAYRKAKMNNAEAHKILIHYASYGDHWDAIAECTVPVDEPFLIKTAEKRGLHLGEPGEVASSHSKPRGWFQDRSSSQLVVWGDAQSNHVNIRVTDTNVELKVKRLRALTERHRVVNELPLYYEATPEFIGFYDSGRKRYFRLWIDLPLRSSAVATISRVVILGLIASALIAFGFFVFHWFDVGSGTMMSGTDVAVILIPSAIAASLLLIRESSTLSTELNKASSMATAMVLAVLWVCTLVAYAAQRIEWSVQ
ncbi:hypothetical protein [Streptomyces coeruleorubidus]|uniref:hypothetical protein n=1 Tax=Streptomyces coeruleorubidus TaxID=116188 RepID=UPI0033ABFE46